MGELKRHPVPEEVDTDEWTLRVTGAVERPLALDRRDLTSFPLETFAREFACEEGWVATDLSWRGVRVEAVLDRASPTAESTHALVRAMDGDYACAFPLDRLSGSILALELDGEPIPPEHGGPARLVPTGSGSDCWESVKWVAAIEVAESNPAEADTAKDLALSRIE